MTKQSDDTDARRAAMVADIVADAKATGAHTGREAFSQRVLDAMGAVPRHAFVRPDDVARAYVNGPLPIGQGQTISQPFVVALMTDVLELTGAERVLEIGVGSGYQTAILGKLAAHVYGVEVLPGLATAAEARLSAQGVRNVTLRTGDGTRGWPEPAPYDAILVAAAPSAVPDALVAQLKPGGRMIIPVGRGRLTQELLLVKKDSAGAATHRSVLPVQFVPLVKG